MGYENKGSRGGAHFSSPDRRVSESGRAQQQNYRREVPVQKENGYRAPAQRQPASGVAYGTRQAQPLQNRQENYTDINSYSRSDRQPPKKGKDNSKKKKIIISAVCVFLAIVFAVVGTGFIYVGNLFGKYVYDDQTGASSTISSNKKPGQTSSTPSKVSPAKVQKEYDAPEIIDGLYHDDAVLNILLLGVDDYHEDDVGRTDSMMLVSIDRRHGELKVTSFMRDMYVNIADGWGANRINTAYSCGGAELLIQTIEENFNVDIDRYVEINYEAFPKIIDALGGVDIDLSYAEAEEINRCEGTSLTGGLTTLTGVQAWRYASMRAISNAESDDYGRTLRQRIVIASIVEKFKTSNLLTITQLADTIVPMVTSNLTQEEILAIVTDALTYMNYNMQQCRIPSDEMHYLDMVLIGGMDASVIIPDTAWNALYLNEFVYGDAFPQLQATLEYNGYSLCTGE